MTNHSMTATTRSFDAQTTSFVPSPTRASLAARSLSAVQRLDGESRRRALDEHFEMFPPVVGAVRRS